MVNWKAARNPRFVGCAAAVLGVVALWWLRWSGVNAGSWVDLEVYVRGAEAIVTRAPLYEPQAGVLPFTYSPFAAVVFTPLHLLSPTGARWVFTLGSLVSYLVVVGVCGWRLRLSWRLLALVALAARAGLRRRRLMGGNASTVAGVAHPAATGGFCPLRRRRYWSGGLFGISHWGPIAVVDGKNQSLIGELARISHDPSPLLVTALVLSASGLALGIAAAHRQLLAPPMSPLAWVSWPCGHLASVAGAAANPLQRRTRRGA